MLDRPYRVTGVRCRPMARLYSCRGKSHPSPALLHHSNDAHKAMTLGQEGGGMLWKGGMRVKNDRFTGTLPEQQVFTATACLCPGKLRVSAPSATVTLFLIP